MSSLRSKLKIRNAKTCDTLTIGNSTDSQGEDSCQVFGNSRKHRIRKLKSTYTKKMRLRTRHHSIIESDSEDSQLEIPSQSRLLKQIGLEVEEDQKAMIQQTQTLRFRGYQNKNNYRFFCYPDQIVQMDSSIRGLVHIAEVDFDVESDDEQIENSIKSMSQSLKEAVESEIRAGAE